MDLIGDGQLQCLFDTHAVDEVEMRAVLGAQQTFYVVLVYFFGEAAVEEQRFPLTVRDQGLDFVTEALRKEEPVEGLATHEIAVSAAADALFRQGPLAYGLH